MPLHLGLEERRLNTLADKLRATGAPVHLLLVDVRDALAVDEAASSLAPGPVDVLVNAVGILRQYQIQDMEPADFADLIAVQVRGVYLLLRAFVPTMPGGSAIVNFGSVAGDIRSEGGWSYTMTQGAVFSTTFGLAQELAPRGIRVNAICPGWVDAGFAQHDGG